MVGLLIVLIIASSWIIYIAEMRYLEEHYPTTYNWLKGGCYFQKATFYFYPLYNFNRAFDLIFQKSAKFSKDHSKEAELLEEYQRLIKDRWYIFEKVISYIYLIAAALGLMYFIYLNITGQIPMKSKH